jgi:hypothetical protein
MTSSSLIIAERCGTAAGIERCFQRWMQIEKRRVEGRSDGG